MEEAEGDRRTGRRSTLCWWIQRSPGPMRTFANTKPQTIDRSTGLYGSCFDAHLVQSAYILASPKSQCTQL